MARNGIYQKDGKKHYANAHFSYKGKSVIIDYEFMLHDYLNINEEKEVPFEIYPYGEYGCHIGICPLDENFHKADIGQLIKIIDKAIENYGVDNH